MTADLRGVVLACACIPLSSGASRSGGEAARRIAWWERLLAAKWLQLTSSTTVIAAKSRSHFLKGTPGALMSFAVEFLPAKSRQPGQARTEEEDGGGFRDSGDLAPVEGNIIFIECLGISSNNFIYSV